MRRSSLVTRKRRRPEINIIPLIDISVKLIFFFLVSMQFREASALNLTLPRVETAGAASLADLTIITVAKDGRMFFRGEPVDLATLERHLQVLLRARGDAAILIRSDRDTPLQSVLTAMDACRKLGLNRIRLQTQ